MKRTGSVNDRQPSQSRAERGGAANDCTKQRDVKPRKEQPAPPSLAEIRGHPFMMSAPRGGGGSGKADKVREVA